MAVLPTVEFYASVVCGQMSEDWMSGSYNDECGLISRRYPGHVFGASHNDEMQVSSDGCF